MWGGKWDHGIYSSFHENQDVVQYLLMDLSFSLTQLHTEWMNDNTHPTFLVKWKKQPKNWTEQYQIQFWALIVKSLFMAFHAFDYKT
jgi:hypothetical protein